MVSSTKIRRAIESPSVVRMAQFLSERYSFEFSSKPNSGVPSIRRYFHQHTFMNSNKAGTTRATTSKVGKNFRPIDAIGIVAAVCRPTNLSSARSDVIIGVNRKLPWDSIPKDRAIFEDLTRDRIIIVGRRTLLNERDGNLDHVRHAKHCIVVSNSISNLSEDPRLAHVNMVENDLEFLKLARSLDHALDLARDLVTTEENAGKSEDGDENRQDFLIDVDSETGEKINVTNAVPFSLPSTTSRSNIQCWIAGGEQLYEESLQHPSALELHLSVVDVDIDLDVTGIEHVAMFPAKHRWSKNYGLVSSIAFPSAELKAPNASHHHHQQDGDDENRGLRFEYHVYRRIASTNKIEETV